MFIFSHYLVFHNTPRSHYQLIYTISPPQHCQLNKAKGFLRSRLTDLSLICTTAPPSPITRANKPPTTRPDKCTDYTAALLHRVCHVGGCKVNRAGIEDKRQELQRGLNVATLRLEVTMGEWGPR